MRGKCLRRLTGCRDVDDISSSRVTGRGETPALMAVILMLNSNTTSDLHNRVEQSYDESDGSAAAAAAVAVVDR